MSRIIQSYEPFTSNEFFISLADIIIVNERHIKNRFLKCRGLDPDKRIIIFIASPLLYQCINLLNSLQNKYILITSCNIDICIPYLRYPCTISIAKSTDILLNSNKLIRWYTKNPSIEHPKIKPIPIGLKWQWNSQHFYGEDNMVHLTLYKSISSDISTIETNFRRSKPNLLYFNFDVNTTMKCFYTPHNQIRSRIKNSLLKNGFKYNDTLPISEYMKKLSTYKFIVSPPGKGIDSHRTWEAILAGCIPIVLSSPLNTLYSTLPVLIVDDFSIVTEDYLNNLYSKMYSAKYDFNLMFSQYWKDDSMN